MARQEYKADQNIHSMNTRQLRKYIADKADEAQERLDSADMKEASKAFKDAADVITNKSGKKVKRSTSNMSKEEMREYAYMLRQFNSLDTISEFQESIEWKENKQKYETFIEKHKNDKRMMWYRFINEDETISPEGFNEWRKYTDFLRIMADVREKFEYETIKKYYREAMKSDNPSERVAVVERLLYEAYEESNKKGLNQKQINDLFVQKLADYDKAVAEEKKYRESKAGVSAKRKKASTKSTNNIKSRQGRKMKEHGKVRR